MCTVRRKRFRNPKSENTTSKFKRVSTLSVTRVRASARKRGGGNGITLFLVNVKQINYLNIFHAPQRNNITTSTEVVHARPAVIKRTVSEYNSRITITSEARAVRGRATWWIRDRERKRFVVKQSISFAPVFREQRRGDVGGDEVRGKDTRPLFARIVPANC